jgi:hypothetical protein
VTLSRRSSITDVAATVAAVLRESSFTAVLTGGACATIYSGGAYQSYDLDYVIQAGGRKRALDEAMARAGFARAGDRYEHPKVRFFVEFVRGPLAIGDDVAVRPTMASRGSGANARPLTHRCVPGSTGGVLSLERSPEPRCGDRHRGTSSGQSGGDSPLERA